MGKQPESHYNIDKLHAIFAISALVLLAALGGLFMKDYDRKWKEYQKAFRTLEIEKTRMAYDEQEKLLAANPEYQAIQEELNKVKESFERNCSNFADINKEISSLKASTDLVNQEYKFKKAELDAARYRYEYSQGHHKSESSEEYQTFITLEKKVNELKISYENSQQELDTKTQLVTDCGNELKEVEKKERLLASKVSLIKRKLKSIDPAEMTLTNEIANMVRDLPIIDLSTPTVKIQQIVTKDITDNLIFTQVPRVERCTTCHLGIANPAYKDAQQPFKTHPNLELFLGNDSAHPVEEFGCTSCHSGRSRGTSFISAAHSPKSEEQKKEWEEKYGWEPLHHWDEPMYPLQHTQAGCFKCHSGEASIKGGEKLNLGLNIIERAGCYNCHQIDRYKDWGKSGPNLTFLASKVSKEWAYKWIKNPKNFRHNTWMPSYFNQSNNNDPASLARNDQEIHAIVSFLFSQSENFSTAADIKNGNSKKGEELVKSVGCLACHQIEPEKKDIITSRNSLKQQHGPNLIGLGSKTSKEWLVSWLKDPQRYSEHTRMPNLRLTDEEANDIAAFLSESKAESFDKEGIPAVDEKIISEIAFDFLKKSYPSSAAQKKLDDMNLNEKMIFSGEKLVSHYGCFACHDIKGFENAKKIGVELNEEGDKSLHKFDFGFVHIDHTKNAWISQKLRDPRSFDQAKAKEPLDKLIMPNFELNEDEIEAVTTAVLGFVNQSEVEKKKVKATAQQVQKEQGQQLIRQFNCQACHNIEAEEGVVQQTVKEWLINYQNRTPSEAEAFYSSYSPPSLFGVGKKLDPQWLFEFLHNPSTKVRPWLKVRMPTYSFNEDHLNVLLEYFASLDNEQNAFEHSIDPFLTQEEYVSAEKLFSKDYFGCTQCHVVGSNLPSGKEDSWAPNLALAQFRLQHDWLLEWIKNPQSLMPGTKMPTFYDPENFDKAGPEDILQGDENEQIRVLRNFLLTLTDSPEAKDVSENSSTQNLQ